MAKKFFTKTGEENFISTLKSNGLKIANLPKYFILRLAINKSFRLPYYSLDNTIWQNTITHEGTAKNEGEYNYEQIIGSGAKNDYEDMIRTMFAFRHKGENLDFGDDSVFENTLEKYLHRGLLEIYNTFKSSDDFYQWLIDDFGLKNTPAEISTQAFIDEQDLLNYFKSENLDIEILNINDSIRHRAYKIHINSEKDYKKLARDIESFGRKFGLIGEAILEQVRGEAMSFYIYLPKNESEWNWLGRRDFEADIKNCDAKGEILAYCGRNMQNKACFFDLVSCPHIFVAGSTGGGKSVLLHNIIVSIARLNSNVEFVLIDPKGGSEFGVYENLLNLSEICDKKVIKNAQDASKIFENLVDEMERRYVFFDENNVRKNTDLTNPFDNIVVVVDEVADLLGGDKALQNLAEKLAQKARASGIFLLLATQSPNSQLFSQSLRVNIPTRIALKTGTTKQSEVILDESGAQNLLGKGDMYFKPNGKEKFLAFAPFLSSDDIKMLL